MEMSVISVFVYASSNVCVYVFMLVEVTKEEKK